jgi:ubiquinol-cytochrome c reductase cytochrome b subunit
VVPSILFFLIFICFVPDFLSHTDNYIPANPLVTPTHIVPEWYFLPFYAILRSIPNKVGGIVLLIFTLILLFLLPYSIFYQFRNVTFNVLAQISAGLFGVIYCILGWLGGNPIEFPYVTVSQFFTLGLFFFLMIGIDMIGIFYA